MDMGERLEERGVAPARVAVGVGLSGESGYVLEKVVALAGDPSRVAAVHVIAPKHQLYNLGGRSPQVYDLVSENVTERLARLCERFGVANYHVRRGHSPLAITEFANEAGAAIVAVGTHGRQGYRRFLGQTANDVLHRSDTDVLAVQTPDELPPVAPAYRRILVAVDFAVDVDRVLDRAATLQRHFDAEMDVAMVIRPASYVVGGIGLEATEEARDLDTVARDRVNALAEAMLAKHPNIEKAIVRHGHTATELQEVTVETGADLVVLGVGRSNDDWIGSSPTLVHDIRQDLFCVRTESHNGSANLSERD